VFIFRVNRRPGAPAALVLPGGLPLDWNHVCRILDCEGITDGFPFVVERDGSFDGCIYLNQYLLEALFQDGLDVRSMSRFHIYHLVRLLEFVRLRRAQEFVEEADAPVDEPARFTTFPTHDLTSTTREDLLAYRDVRQQVVKKPTLKTELGCIAGFFRHALARGWIQRDPIPRWGAKDRNTLMPRSHRIREEKFVPADVLRLFLQRGSGRTV
jgi:hypothetical protein